MTDPKPKTDAIARPHTELRHRPEEAAGQGVAPATTHNTTLKPRTQAARLPASADDAGDELFNDMPV